MSCFYVSTIKKYFFSPVNSNKMKIVKFLTSLLLTVGIIFALNTSVVYEGKPIPAFGQLLNPFNGFWQNGEPPTPLNFEALSDTSLINNVKVVYDDRRVPHIFAQNDNDAHWVQGYVTARDRLWQMDFVTRSTSGRLSEILGEKYLEYDQKKRRKGMVFAAENTIKGWKKDSIHFQLLEAYTAGVNAYINSLKSKDIPVEFKLLGYQPEEWTTLKTALFSKAMGESLAGRYSDLKATNTLAKFGPNAFRFLYPEKFPDDLPIVPKEIEYNFEKLPTEDIAAPELENTSNQTLSYHELAMPDNNLGSNNWAVARGKTAESKPILAGDPHLQLTLPSIWYEIHIHTPTSNAYGVSLPGIPSVVIGFNEDIAWSQTNVGHDVADLYTITWEDSTRQKYLLDGNYVAAKKVVEKYTLKKNNLPFGLGTEEIEDTVRYTHWGPVIYESTDFSEKDLALRWLVHDEPSANELTVFSKLNKAKNYEEFANAIKGYNSPAQNFAFASKTGAIALKVQGKHPLKSAGQGRFIQNGSSTKNAWKGFIPETHNPTVYNPHWGYISSANQRSTAANYPYYYNRESFEAYRGRILQRKLFKAKDITVEDMKALQNNSYSMKAELALPIFLSRIKPETLNDGEKAFLELITKWDYHYSKEQLEPLYFNTWFKEFYKMTWDEIGEDEAADNLLYPTEWRTCFILRDVPETNYFDIKATPEKETAWDIIELSFKSAVQKVLTEIIERPDLNWSNHRNTTIAHLGRIPSFSTKNVYTDGHQNTLNAVRSYAGPSWRMVVELGEETKASVVYPGGQSGNPGSLYYDNFIDTWAAGEYYEAQFVQSPAEIKGDLVITQAFTPAN